MTVEIGLVLGILVVAVVLFVSEKVRMDLVALLVLCALAVTGLVSPAQALAGFSNPAVVTVWAMFIISGGLAKSGVARLIGRQILKLAGSGEARLILVIMLTAALLSTVMNNAGVVAMLLPVVMDIARETKRAPSRLLMPLAFGTLLGGLTTLIGTSSSLLVSEALGNYGLEPFALFDFTPVGGSIVLAGIAFVVLFGRRLLPTRDPARDNGNGVARDLPQTYGLAQNLYTLDVPSGSALVGKTLGESRLGSALRLNVVGVQRAGGRQLAPEPSVMLKAGDRLLVEGQSERLERLRGREHLRVEEESPTLDALREGDMGLGEVRLAEGSTLVGQTLHQSTLRQRQKISVLAILRDEAPQRTDLQDRTLREGDRLLVQGTAEALAALADAGDFASFEPLSVRQVSERYRLERRLFALRVPTESLLAGRSLAESQLSDAFGLMVVAIVRGDEAPHLMPPPDESVEAGDLLLALGKPDDLELLQALQALRLEAAAPPAVEEIQSEEVGLQEVVLSPHTMLAGKTLRQLRFRDRYGLNVLALWRAGTAYRTDLRDMQVELGDALLLHGPRRALRALGAEPDFVVLTEAGQEPLRTAKAPLAVGILVAVLLPVLFGWLSIAIAGVIGATLMVLTRCLTMEEAYRYIEWPAIFLIAGMLPLGTAMEQSGAAALLTTQVIAAVGGMGPLVIVATLFVLTSLGTQIIPTAALAVLMAPIAMNTANDLGLSPYALMMTVAMAAAASFSSPVSHPANLMIMGPGGYSFRDYIKVGLPLTLVVLIVTLLVLPIFWPLQP